MARRSRGPKRYGVGTYDIASDGRHRWRYTTTTATGRRERIGIKKTKLTDLDRAVEEFLTQEQRLGYALDVEQRTVAQYCEAWLEQRVAVKNAPNTVQKYRNDLRRLLPLIGAVKLRILRPNHIQAAIHELSRQTNADGTPRYRPRTVTDAARALHAALAPLVREGILARNPADAALLDLPRNRPYQPQILSADDLARLLRAARGHWIEVLLHTYAATGLRRGEALGLRWEDLDFEARLIRPVQAVKTVGSAVTIGPLKTEASRQPIPISEDLAWWLELQRQRVWTMRLAHGGPAWRAYNLVFPSRVGTPWCPNNMTRVFKKLLAEAGLPTSVTIHGLRHSYGTLVAQHANARVVQRLLRHANVASTYRYIHSDESQERNATEAVAETLRKRRN